MEGVFRSCNLARRARPTRSREDGLDDRYTTPRAGFAFAVMMLLSATAPAGAVEIDPGGQVATLPPIGDHWLFVPDRLFQHSALFDGDTGQMLGSIPSPGAITPKLPLTSRTRNEFYSVDVDYSRGVRGTRTDYVTVYDAETLDVEVDIDLPHPVSSSNTSQHHTTLLDGDRFMVVFSQFPDTLAMVVDLDERSVASSAPIAGCAGVYATGPRSFATLCGDGTTVRVDLAEDGRVVGTARSPGFFDVVEDPVSMAGVRSGSRWLFVSFLGAVHAVEYGGDAPVPETPWFLGSDSEREGGWRPGGFQPHALHVASNRLFVLMQQGHPGSHKDASPEIWSFDVATESRIARFDVPNLSIDFLGPMMGLESGSFGHTLLGLVVPNGGAHAITVTQDDAPILFTRNAEMGAIGVVDPDYGEHLRSVVAAGQARPPRRGP